MIGKVAPDTVNPAPLIVDELIISGPVPVDVTVIGNVAVEPTFTLPKLRLVELTASCGVARATPVLVRLIAVVGLVEELLVTISVSVTVPIVRAADFTSSVTDWCGLRMIGKVAPDTLNTAPLIVAELIVSGAIPFEVIFTGNVAVDPTVTLLKLRLAELSESSAVPEAGVSPELVAACPRGRASKSTAFGEVCRTLVAGPFVAYRQPEITKIR